MHSRSRYFPIAQCPFQIVRGGEGKPLCKLQPRNWHGTRGQEYPMHKISSSAEVDAVFHRKKEDLVRLFEFVQVGTPKHHTKRNRDATVEPGRT